MYIMMSEGFARHKAFATWLAIMFGSLLFSSFIVLGNPSFTGLAVLADAGGPVVDFNPDYVGKDEYYSSIMTGVIVILLLIITQVILYTIIMKHYKDAEE